MSKPILKRYVDKVAYSGELPVKAALRLCLAWRRGLSVVIMRDTLKLRAALGQSNGSKVPDYMASARPACHEEVLNAFADAQALQWTQDCSTLSAKQRVNRLKAQEVERQLLHLTAPQFREAYLKLARVCDHEAEAANANRANKKPDLMALLSA